MRTWKVGSITCGVLLIGIGLLWFLQNFITIPFVDILLNAWPFVCIFIGAEILFLHFRNKEEKLRVHWLAIVLLVFIGLTSVGLNIGKMFLDEVQFSFYTETAEIKETLSPQSAELISINIQDHDFVIVGNNTNDITVSGKVNGNVKTKKILKDQFKKKLTMKQIGNQVFIEINHNENGLGGVTDINGTLYLSVPKNANLSIQSDRRVDLSDITGKVTMENWDNATFRNFTGTLNVKAHSSIDISDSLLNGNSTINIESGALNWKLTPEQTGNFQASTKDGEIKGNIPWVFKTSENTSTDQNDSDNRNNQNASATIGENPGSSILITSSYGPITLSK